MTSGINGRQALVDPAFFCAQRERGSRVTQHTARRLRFSNPSRIMRPRAGQAKAGGRRAGLAGAEACRRLRCAADRPATDLARSPCRISRLPHLSARLLS